jgi:beta-lactam-binding protein with PASTA domain
MNRFLKGIGILLALIAVGVVSAIAVIMLLLRQEEVRVPDLVNRDIVTVIEMVSQQGLQLKVDRREPSQTVPKDAVIAQDPQAGIGLKKGRAVHVVVSQGPSELLTPKLTGEQYRKADLQLRQGGLLPPDIARIWSDNVERDIVIAQDPPAGTPLDKGTRIGLLVSLGRKARVLVMPKLVGKRAEEAVRLVNRLGIQHRVTSISTSTAGSFADRTVVSQKPLAGFPLPVDGMVDLVLSK